MWLVTVVDIRSFNKIMLPDVYSMPSQANILAAIQRATHISMEDCSAFFYQ